MKGWVQLPDSCSAPGALAADPAPPLELAHGHLHPCQIPAFPGVLTNKP